MALGLTQEEVDQINVFLDDELDAENPRGFEHMISDLCAKRDNIRSLLAIHTGIEHDNAIGIRNTVRAQIVTIAQEIITLASP